MSEFEIAGLVLELTEDPSGSLLAIEMWHAPCTRSSQMQVPSNRISIYSSPIERTPTVCMSPQVMVLTDRLVCPFRGSVFCLLCLRRDVNPRTSLLRRGSLLHKSTVWNGCLRLGALSSPALTHV